MALAYVKPGVSVDEVLSPAAAPVILDPTSICIVGPGQGFQQYTEVFVLDDNHEVTLQAANPDPTTIVVVDASNTVLAPFTATSADANRDYTIDTSALTTNGTIGISRSMQTTIADDATVVVYFENSASPAQGDARTSFVPLAGTVAASPAGLSSTTQLASFKVKSQGLCNPAEYAIVGAGTPTVTIQWQNTATVLAHFETVYLDYLVGSIQHSDVAVQLNGTTPVALAANATSIVVKNAPGAPTNANSVLYTKGTTTDFDYIISGTGTAITIARSAGTTQIGVAADALAVRVSYRATPSDYWLPTRCFSQHDVQDKFGPALDNAGNVVNPVSLAAALCFENGAPSVVIQALFSETNGVIAAPIGGVTDWETTLENLRDIEDVNVIVPLIQTGGLTNTDSLNLQILQKVQAHLQYMQAQDQFGVAICGEDSSQATKAAMATLRAHAQALGSGTPAEAMVLLSPASYTISNPVTGSDMTVGGQYAAACVAGVLARYPVQTPLTRKQVTGLTAVKESRSEADKNTDAASGLMVIEAKRGVVQVRHAITTATDTKDRSELSVVRAKHFMMESIRQSIDSGLIGQLVLDANATYQVQLLVTAVLEQLIADGNIVSYHDVQARRNPIDVTAIDVQFAYLPAFPLNNVNVSFSIDSSQGVVFSDQAAPTQGI